MQTPRNSLCFGVVCLALILGSLPARAQELRDSAWTVAQWALATGNTTALADSIGLYLQEGGVIEADDPFSAHALIEGLRALPGGEAEVERLLATRARGQFGGAPRVDLTLAPGEIHETDLRLVAKEITWIEARLWRGSVGANIDLELVDSDGKRLTMDADLETGTEGNGALLQYAADTCLDVVLRVTNAGSGQGRVAILIPQSVRSVCGGSE